VAVLPDGRVVTSGRDRRVLIWDPARPGTDPDELGRHDGCGEAVAVLPDGRVVSSGRDRRVLIWDPARPGTDPAELGQHDGNVAAMAVLPDGRIVTSGRDRRVLIWDPVRVGAPVIQLSFSAIILAAASPGTRGCSLAIAHEGGGLSLWTATA
jgi:WD40 repeat protein